MRPHRWQPTRLPCPWDSPGKNTGVGCHFLLQCMKVKSESGVTQSCPTLRDPMDCSPPGSSVHGIFQARVLEWAAIAFSDSSSLLGFKPSNLALDCTISYCCGQWIGRENKRVTGVSKRRRKRGSIILQCFPVSGWFHRQLPYWVYSIQQVRNGSLNSKGSISVPAHIFCPIQLPRRD